MQLTDRDWELLQVIWDYMLIEDSLPGNADVAVVGGSGPLTDGALRAAELYHAGVVRNIVVSGWASPEFDNSRSEADLLSESLIHQGVDSADILLDHKATNTGENIINSAKLLTQAIIQSKKVILIHKPFMTRRFLATAQAQWPQPQPELYVTSWPTTLKDYYSLYANLYGSEEKMVYLMLGDYKRLKTYPEKGFSVEQPESPEADQAYDELVRRGFMTKEVG